MFCCRWYLDNKINEICICFLTSRINNNLLVWVGEQQLDRLNGYAKKFKSVHIAGWAQHSFLISASCGWAWTFKIRILLLGVESFPFPFSTIHPLRSWISGSDTTNCCTMKNFMSNSSLCRFLLSSLASYIPLPLGKLIFPSSVCFPTLPLSISSLKSIVDLPRACHWYWSWVYHAISIVMKLSLYWERQPIYRRNKYKTGMGVMLSHIKGYGQNK